METIVDSNFVSHCLTHNKIIRRLCFDLMTKADTERRGGKLELETLKRAGELKNPHLQNESVSEKKQKSGRC